VQYVSCN